MAGSIICGVDDTPGARRAVTVAAELAVDLGRPLILVHVADGDSQVPYGDGARRERRRHAAWQRGHALIAELCDRYHGRTKIQERIEPGVPAMKLARVAEEERAGFLVVGSRGRGEIRSALLGSVSHSLERVAPCPLVVVPPGVSASEAEHVSSGGSIVCGVGDPETQSGLVEFAASLAGAVVARLEVVHAHHESGWDGGALTAPLADVWPPEGDPGGKPSLLHLETAMHVADAHGVPADARLAAGPAALVLERVAQREDARLIVIGSRRGGTVRLLLRGSVSRRLAQVGTTPIVIAPEGTAADRVPALPRNDEYDAGREPTSEALRRRALTLGFAAGSSRHGALPSSGSKPAP